MHHDTHRQKVTAAKILAALGVVYGDIGTSPLYALRECFSGHYGIVANEQNILGILSLICWSLIVVITFKYLFYVMRAHNKGEGGVLALHALLHGSKNYNIILFGLGIFGAALLYGDSAITPAISVLSAMEGLSIVTERFDPFIVPLTLIVLTTLFSIQHRGTHLLGKLFGPIIMLWFTALAALGIRSIIDSPEVLAAFNPAYAVHYFQQNGFHGFATLGSVFLVVTGGEALYADMGHFGRRTIQYGWLIVAFPALLLNYLGQGALLLRDPTTIQNPFYLLVPEPYRIAMVVLATLATIIASQAVISGAFSLTRQAVQLGLLPRLEIRHTSKDEIGQIYVPLVNWLLAIVTGFLVLLFLTSSNLAAAYGIAVTLTMVITTILIAVVSYKLWHLPLYVVAPLALVFLIIDIGFFSANLLKLFQGGYVPFIMGLAIFMIMTTWQRGRQLLSERLSHVLMTPQHFIDRALPTIKFRLPGAAVFMARSAGLVPPALLHNVQHNRVLHETVALLSVQTSDAPSVSQARRCDVLNLGHGIYSVVIRYGFLETPNIPAALKLCIEKGLPVQVEQLTYYFSRETLIATPLPGMALWRDVLFAFMTRNAHRAASYFKIPSTQVVELGMVIEI